MILKSVFLIKALLIVGCLLFPRWKNHSKGTTTKYKPGYAVGILICLVLAQLAASLTPALTDQMTLTALGEKSPSAQAEEIVLRNFTVDGKDAAIKSPIDGKWFWVGNTYAWRTESDTRQPDGTTRSITLKVPVGWSRTANFEGAIWRGKVEITTPQGTQIADTYAETDETVYVVLGRSTTSLLILNQQLHLGVFAVILLAGAWCLLHFSNSEALNDSQWRARWWERHCGKALYGAIALIAFCGMVLLANRQSFWVDELLGLAAARGTLKGVVELCLNMDDATPPLFNFCAALWYRIAPYGQRWLLLVSIVPTVLSVYFAGLIGERVRNRFCGALTAALLAFSNTIWINQAHEFRAYAFLGLFSTLSLYCFIRRNEAPQKWKWHVLLGLSMTAMALSHYFGMLACGCIFLVDAVLFFRKKLSARAMLSYLMAGSVSLSWLVLVYITTLSRRSTASIASWYPIPTLQHILSLLRELAGSETFTQYLFLLGISAGVATFLWQFGEHDKKFFYYGMSLWMICFPIGLVFVYGNFVNQSSTMWQSRYFLFLPIYIALISALGITDLVEILENAKNQKKLKSLVGGFLLLILVGNCLPFQAGLASNIPLREAGEWLNKQANYIYNKDTVVIGSWYGKMPVVAEAWEDYYVTQQGKRDPVNACISQDNITPSDLQSYNWIYLQYSFSPVAPWLQEILSIDFTVIEDHPEVQIAVYQRNVPAPQ